MIIHLLAGNVSKLDLGCRCRDIQARTLGERKPAPPDHQHWFWYGSCAIARGGSHTQPDNGPVRRILRSEAHEQITPNPFHGFQRTYTADRSEIIWTETDTAKFMAGAPLEQQQALILAICTGQRYGDLIRLRWSDFDGSVIRLVQSKTKAKVTVPVSTALKHMVEEMPKQGLFSS